MVGYHQLLYLYDKRHNLCFPVFITQAIKQFYPHLELIEGHIVHYEVYSYTVVVNYLPDPQFSATVVKGEVMTCDDPWLLCYSGNIVAGTLYSRIQGWGVRIG